MNDFVRDRRGSAVRGFAMAAVALSIASMAGAHALNWLARSDHVALVAYRAPPPRRPHASPPTRASTRCRPARSRRAP